MQTLSSQLRSRELSLAAAESQLAAKDEALAAAGQETANMHKVRLQTGQAEMLVILAGGFDLTECCSFDMCNNSAGLTCCANSTWSACPWRLLLPVMNLMCALFCPWLKSLLNLLMCALFCPCMVDCAGFGCFGSPA